MVRNNQNGNGRKLRLTPRRGRPYVYRVVPNVFGKGWCVDSGFSRLVRREMPGVEPREGMIVRSHKVPAEEVPGGYRFTEEAGGEDLLHTYRAVLSKNRLGYAFKVSLDFGFHSHMEMEVRLRGIRGPVPRAGVGRELMDFVGDALGHNSFVVRTTMLEAYWTDGCYEVNHCLADVFFMLGDEPPERVAAEGLFLNQLMLDSGLVRPEEDDR